MICSLMLGKVNCVLVMIVGGLVVVGVLIVEIVFFDDMFYVEVLVCLFDIGNVWFG